VSRENLKDALRLAQQGMKVIPLYTVEDGVCDCGKMPCPNKPGKHPRITGWQKRASSSLNDVLRWWKEWPAANIGVVCGASGAVVVDVDPRSGGIESMDALVAEHPQYTRGLRASCFMLDARQTREFERAMAELQQGLWIVKTEERYEPSFSYRWDLLEAWLPNAVAAGRRLTRTEAARRLVERYVRAAIFTRPAVLRRLFGLNADEIALTMTALARRGVVVETAVAGWPGRWLVHASAVSSNRGVATP